VNGHLFTVGDVVEYRDRVPGRWPLEVQDTAPCLVHDGCHQQLQLEDPQSARVWECSPLVRSNSALRELCAHVVSAGGPVRTDVLRELAPWAAVVVARTAARSGVDLEQGTLEQLVAEALAVGCTGRLGEWWRR